MLLKGAGHLLPVCRACIRISLQVIYCLCITSRLKVTLSLVLLSPRTHVNMTRSSKPPFTFKTVVRQLATAATVMLDHGISAAGRQQQEPPTSAAQRRLQVLDVCFVMQLQSPISKHTSSYSSSGSSGASIRQPVVQQLPCPRQQHSRQQKLHLGRVKHTTTLLRRLHVAAR